MIAIIFGSLLVALLVIAVLLVFWILVDTSSLNDLNVWIERSVKAVLVILMIASLIVVPKLFITIETNANSKEIEKFTAKKEVFEASMSNSSLSGLERLELVKQVIEANDKLIGMQYDCKQWYGFMIDKAVLELEPISLN